MVVSGTEIPPASAGLEDHQNRRWLLSWSKHTTGYRPGGLPVGCGLIRGM